MFGVGRGREMVLSLKVATMLARVLFCALALFGFLVVGTVVQRLIAGGSASDCWRICVADDLDRTGQWVGQRFRLRNLRAVLRDYGSGDFRGVAPSNLAEQEDCHYNNR